MSESSKLEEKRLKLKLREEEFKLKTEIRVSEAENKILTELEQSGQRDVRELKLAAETVNQIQASDEINNSFQAPVITSTPLFNFPRMKNRMCILRVIQVKIVEMTKMTLLFAKELRKPVCDIHTFSGNALE